MKNIGRIALAVAGAALMLPVLLFPVRQASAQTRADTPNNPFAGDPTAIASGKTVFDATCSACHGAGATGGRGPALNTGNFIHGNDDFDLFQTNN